MAVNELPDVGTLGWFRGGTGGRRPGRYRVRGRARASTPAGAAADLLRAYLLGMGVHVATGSVLEVLRGRRRRARDPLDAEPDGRRTCSGVHARPAGVPGLTRAAARSCATARRGCGGRRVTHWTGAGPARGRWTLAPVHELAPPASSGRLQAAVDRPSRMRRAGTALSCRIGHSPRRIADRVDRLVARRGTRRRRRSLPGLPGALGTPERRPRLPTCSPGVVDGLAAGPADPRLPCSTCRGRGVRADAGAVPGPLRESTRA